MTLGPSLLTDCMYCLARSQGLRLWSLGHLHLPIILSDTIPANYTVYRKDRNSKCHGGGVFQAIKNDLIVLYRPEFDADCEIIWTQCQLAGSNTKSIFFGSFYRPKATDSECLEALQS